MSAGATLFGFLPAGSTALGSTDSYVLPLVLGVVAVAMITLVVFAWIKNKANRPTTTVLGPVDLFQPANPQVVSRSDVRKNMMGTYTLSFYIKIDSVPDMRARPPIVIQWPGAWYMLYDGTQEQLIIDSLTTTDVSGIPIEFGGFTVPSVPLQRWNQITLVFEGRSFDIFLNGQPIASRQLNNLPPVADASVTIEGNNVMGQLAYVQLWPRRLLTGEIVANYQDTSDSQGRPYLGPEFLTVLPKVPFPNLYCPGGNCGGSSPSASPAQNWEFPYA